MKVDILAGGSGGNCIAVRSGSTTILIDAGIAKTKIEKRLLEAGIRPDEIDAIFLTHAHKDHVQGLALANKYRIPVFAGAGEWRDVRVVDNELRREMVWGECAPAVGQAVVRFCPAHHDAYEPYCYIIDADKTCSICLDTGHVDAEMIKAMRGSDIYIIEANHDPDMLAASDYPEAVKARILSDLGHLSNQQAAEALAKLVRGRGEWIYLTHLSKTNNIRALARMTVEYELRRKGFDEGTDYFLEVV